MKLKPCMCLLLVVVARAVVFSASVGDALAIAALSALYGFDLYLESKKEVPINDSIKEEISALKSAISALKLQKSLR